MREAGLSTHHRSAAPQSVVVDLMEIMNSFSKKIEVLITIVQLYTKRWFLSFTKTPETQKAVTYNEMLFVKSLLVECLAALRTGPCRSCLFRGVCVTDPWPWTSLPGVEETIESTC